MGSYDGTRGRIAYTDGTVIYKKETDLKQQTPLAAVTVPCDPVKPGNKLRHFLDSEEAKKIVG